MRIIQVLLLAAFPFLVFAQDDVSFELDYQVNVVHPSLSVSVDKLSKADSICDLNRFYKPAWVKAFNAVEIIATQKGKTVKAYGENDVLTDEQKALMNEADFGSNIVVNIRYIPNNTLTNNEEKLFDFTFVVRPEKEATFPENTIGLNTYLKQNVLDKINTTTFKQYQLTAIKFTIDQAGEIKNANVFESSKDKDVDKMLLDAVGKMPCWIPATYSDGTPVEQEFVLTVGDHRSCIINLLSIVNE